MGNLLAVSVKPSDGLLSLFCDTNLMCHALGYHITEHPQFIALAKQHIVEMHGIGTFLLVLVIHELRIQKVRCHRNRILLIGKAAVLPCLIAVVFRTTGKRRTDINERAKSGLLVRLCHIGHSLITCRVKVTF